MHRHRKWVVAAVLGLALGSAPAEAKIGLSSQFVNLVLENLEPGKSYNLLALRGLPYTVKNRGEAPVEVAIEVVRPEKDEIIAPYEPIPDPSWMQLSPNRLRLEPDEPGFAALTITIPDDPELIGKHYQGVIWARTLNTGFMAAGVKSYIRFSVGKGPETLAEEERQKAMVSLNYDLWPSALYVNQAKPGKYDVLEAEKRSLLLTNRDTEPLELVVKPAPWRGRLPADYEALQDLSWVKMEPSTVKVDPMSIERIKMVLDVPKEAQGKRYAFMVQLTLPIGTIVNQTNRVFLNIPAAGEPESKETTKE